MRQPETTKAAILQAVTRIVADEGADALTIEEVAQRAAISKGGVLHHFPSKEALLVAAFANDLDQFDEAVDRFQQADPAMPGAYTRAYLRASAETYESPSGDCLAFLYQFRYVPATVQLVRTFKERWQQRVEEDGLDPAISHLVRFASDGIWLASATGGPKLASFRLVVEKLLDLARVPDGAAGAEPDGPVNGAPRR